MKIAVWINENLSPEVGGTFSYVDRLIESIDNYVFSEKLEICFVTSYFVEVRPLNKKLIRLCSPYDYILSYIPFLRRRRKIQRLVGLWCSSSYRRQLEENGVKLLLYPIQFVRPIKNFPFAAMHWDIAHRSTFAFPEFSFYLHRQRDEYYKNFLPKALMIFVESDAGKRELVRYSGLNEDRIAVVPIFAGNCATLCVSQMEQDNVLKDLNLERFRYFYYPAQYLAEKNHYAIIEAFSKIVSKYPDYKVVFTGSSSEVLFGTLNYLKAVVCEFGLKDKVLFAPFQSQEGVYSLYKNACAHIMASYVGPTNMPPLEAMFIGCPVICSDISGHKEEMEDAAIYFDPQNTSQLADAMIEMIENRNVYLTKIQNLSLVTKFTMENALNSINDNLLEASVIRRTWG